MRKPAIGAMLVALATVSLSAPAWGTICGNIYTGTYTAPIAFVGTVVAVHDPNPPSAFTQTPPPPLAYSMKVESAQRGTVFGVQDVLYEGELRSGARYQLYARYRGEDLYAGGLCGNAPDLGNRKPLVPDEGGVILPGWGRIPAGSSVGLGAVDAGAGIAALAGLGVLVLMARARRNESRDEEPSDATPR